jgi:hypothetical protein
MFRTTLRRQFVIAAGLTTGLLAVLISAPAIAASQGTPTSPSGIDQVTVFASGSTTIDQPDDITELGGDIFVGWQNGLGPLGQPGPGGGTTSEVIEYSKTGAVIDEWAVTGKVDGLTAYSSSDSGSAHPNEVVATSNEDGNSSLFTINPGAAPTQQVVHYTYNLNPLPSGGGTDAISVVQGQLLISASAPTVADGPALYKVTLAGSVATVQPVLFDNSPAKVANVNAPNQGSTISLKLIDPDSNEVVPSDSVRFGGDLLLTSQGDQEQIFVNGATSVVPQSSVLSLSQAVDDTAWATDATGTLYATDGVDNEVFALTGDFTPGSAFTSVTPGDANTPVYTPGYVGILDLHSGAITPVVTTIQPKGLLFVP